MAAIPTILRGDDSGAITITMATGRTYAGATLVVAYQGVVRSFTGLTPGQTLTLAFTHDETATFALGTAPLLMRLIGQYGAEETVENADARIRVTDCLAEVNAGGSFVVQPGGSAVDPTKVPITDVGDMTARYTLADLKEKVDQIVRVLAQRSLLGLALVASFCAMADVTVQTARLDELYNDALVVTNVTGGGGGGADTNAVNDLIATYVTTNAATTNLTARLAAKVGQGDVDATLAASNLCTVAAAVEITNAMTFAQLKSKPNTLSGYGITDAIQSGSDKAYWTGHNELWVQGTILAYGGLNLMGWNNIVVPSSSQTLPQYLASGNWNTATGDAKFAKIGEIPSTNGFVTASVTNGLESAYHASATYQPLGDYATRGDATNAAVAVVSPVSNRVDYLDGYIAGQRVRVSVTNYYGNTSGQLPRLRIEEFITATNVVGGVSTETNYWQIVWDEQNKYDLFLQEARTAVAAMTNNLYQTYYQLLQERLATKAPRAWGTLTSAGEAAPPGSVWHTEPNTVFAGGTEYAHAMVGTGVIGVLTTKGAAVYTDGETGRFHFTTDDRQSYFGMNIASRYEIGCATDGISVTPVGGDNMVDLTYNITMTGKPILYYTPTLNQPVTWEQITDSAGGAVPGATVYASWDQSPPAGSEICTINCGAALSGFFKASVEYAGVSKFETNMMADLAGGIVATNQVNNQMQPVEPYITTNGVKWRVKQ